MERLQKILSVAGVCSRREAEIYIRAERITVNGEVAHLGGQADPEKDEIALDGRVIPAPGARVYLMLNKPKGYVTTLSDPFGRPVVTDLTRDCGERIYPIGRLDRDSEGLLLLTNDGNFSLRLSHPSFETEKEYHVTIGGNLRNCVKRLEAVRELDGMPIAPVKIEVVSKMSGKWILSMTLHQGLNRQIRRMCRAADLGVLRLERVREGSLLLGGLPQGTWRYLTGEEVEAAYRDTYEVENRRKLEEQALTGEAANPAPEL